MGTPQLSLVDKNWWGAIVTIPSWTGFQARGGPYGATSQIQPSDGTVQVCYAPEGRGTEPLAAGELNLIDWFFAHEAEVSTAVKQAIFDAYPEIRAQFDADDGPDIADVRSVQDLENLMGLYAVNIHQVSRAGVPYIGFELGCNWDTEHGLGVLMHGTRLVEIGGADTAVLLWIARKDAERFGEGREA